MGCDGDPGPGQAAIQTLSTAPAVEGLTAWTQVQVSVQQRCWVDEGGLVAWWLGVEGDGTGTWSQVLLSCLSVDCYGPVLVMSDSEPSF